MGLLEKTLKKSGIERKKAAPPTPAQTEEKPSVGWLDRSFRERTTALADKIDLESQYARLEEMSQAAAHPPPPKTSLRDRARRFLSGLTGQTPAVAQPVARPIERSKMSLRQRAALLMKKISGGGGGQGSAAGDGGQGTPGHSPHDDRARYLAEYELPEPVFFPWHSLSDEGTLQTQVAFGEEAHAEPHVVAADEAESAAPEIAEAPPEEKAPLNEFAQTLERITENLKNLHVQLDTGNFIRDVPAQPTTAVAALSAPSQPIISHHVPIEEPAPAGAGVATSTAGTRVEAGGLAPQMQPEKARDIFWPKDLPLDLPARDIKLNADGTLSVVPGPLQLPYLAEDIAPAESDLSHFTRNLKNAELFIAEGELQLTRIIYERLLKKIADEEAQRKIRANLDALDNYKKSHDWGNFMPLPPWMNQRNPYQDFRPPQLNVSQMPVEAKSITINLDKGFFEIAKAIFEQQKELIQTVIREKKDDAAARGKLGEEDEKALAEASAEEGAEAGTEEPAESEERRADSDRRKGAPDMRGDGAPDRRSGRDRRADAEAAAAEAEAAAEEEQRAGEDRRRGEADSRGEGAEERRSGVDRREENAAPPPLAADGAAQPPDGQSAAPAEPTAPQAEELAAQSEPPADGVMEPPKIPEMMPDGSAQTSEGQAAGAEGDEGGEGKEKEEENKVQEIRGVLELKTPDQEDTPFLTLTYDFTKIPHAYRLAKDNGIFEYAYYKYKPMLVKAHQFIKRKQITRALNYYRVIREQQIPNEFRHMVDRNIKDITEYLQKYLVTRQN